MGPHGRVLLMLRWRPVLLRWPRVILLLLRLVVLLWEPYRVIGWS